MRSEAEVRSNSTADAITAINKRSIELQAPAHRTRSWRIHHRIALSNAAEAFR